MLFENFHLPESFLQLQFSGTELPGKSIEPVYHIEIGASVCNTAHHSHRMNGRVVQRSYETCHGHEDFRRLKSGKGENPVHGIFYPVGLRPVFQHQLPCGHSRIQKQFIIHGVFLSELPFRTENQPFETVCPPFPLYYTCAGRDGQGREGRNVYLERKGFFLHVDFRPEIVYNHP